MPLHRDTLHAGLLAENAALRTFIEVLRNEPQTLLKGETDLLALFGEPKARLVLELTRLGEQRLQWLRNQGVTADRSGMDQLLSKYVTVQVALTCHGIGNLISKYPDECFEDVASLFA